MPQKLEVDALEINRSSAMQMVDGGKGWVFIEAMLSIAKAFGPCTVVEGVVAIEQLRWLRT